MRTVGKASLFPAAALRTLSCLQPRRFPALNVPWTPTVPSSSRPLLSTASSMSTSTADTISRREKAAQAAERRLRTTAMAAARSTAPPTETGCSDPKAETRPETCKMRGWGATRKRRAEQVGFSDSDSDNDELTCVGVTAVRSTQGGESEGTNSAGKSGGAASDKRGRKGKAAPAAAAASVLGTSTAASSSSNSNLPHEAFRVVSWNIDCLNGENKMARVEEVCAIVLETEPTPDVILLQEVDGDAFPVLNARLGAGGRYRAYPPRVPVESRYFALMFVKIGTVTVLDSGREEFPHSRMGRDLTTIRATFNEKPIMIMTSHFESEKQSSDERKAQFNQALRQLLGFREGPAVFAGDTNLREAEVKQEKLAKEAGDMWQLCGADPDQRFTWDMQKNDNHVFGGGFQPRARYDRMFVNPQAKSSAKAFALLGTQRMAPPHSCFPSDHFGMDARFEW